MFLLFLNSWHLCFLKYAEFISGLPCKLVTLRFQDKLVKYKGNCISESYYKNWLQKFFNPRTLLPLRSKILAVLLLLDCALYQALVQYQSISLQSDESVHLCQTIHITRNSKFLIHHTAELRTELKKMSFFALHGNWSCIEQWNTSENVHYL